MSITLRSEIQLPDGKEVKKKKLLQIANNFNSEKEKTPIFVISPDDIGENQQSSLQPCISMKEDNADCLFIPAFGKLGDKQTWRLVISAPSGSGKSFIADKYLDSLSLLIPKTETNEEKLEEGEVGGLIYLITNLVDWDPAYKHSYNSRKVVKFLADEGIEGVSADDFKDCIVIFDDFEGSEAEKHLRGMVKTLMTQSRKRNVHIVMILHDLKQNQATKQINIEVNHITFFPSYSIKSQVDRYLQDYMSFDEEAISRIKKLKSRSVAVSRVLPMTVVSSKEIYILNE